MAPFWYRRVPDEMCNLSKGILHGDDPNDPTVQEFKARKHPYQNPQTQDTFQEVPAGS